MVRLRMNSFSLAYSALVLIGCNADPSELIRQKDQDQISQPLVTTKPPTHLVFSGIDVLSFPWQSSIFSLRLTDETIETISTGESGDPYIVERGGNVLLFNRTAESQNFRSIEWDVEQKSKLGTQIKYSGGGYGDPHDVIVLNDDIMLVANYTAGTISQLNRRSGDVVATVDADWDLPEGSKLRPEGMTQVSQQDGDRLILVVHQALTFSGGELKVDGSQQVFVLSRTTDDQIVAIDIDPDKDRIQGIPIVGSLPQLSRSPFNDKPFIISMCHRNLVEVGAQIPCLSAVESIDVEKLTTELIWDLDDEGLFMNGPVFGGLNGNAYANVEIKTANDKYTKHMVQLNLVEKSWKKAVDFPDASGGFWGAFFNPSNGNIYVGDTNADGKAGRFIVVDANGQHEIKLDLAPYSGTFVTLE